MFFRNYLNNTSQLGGVLHKVRELLEQGVKPEQIAILYRTNKESMPFAEYLSLIHIYKLVTLSTCALQGSRRFVVQGYLVETITLD